MSLVPGRYIVPPGARNGTPLTGEGAPAVNGSVEKAP